MKYIIEVEVPDGETMDVQKPGLGFKGFVYVKAEQVEDVNDTISRQAVKEWLDKWEGYIDKDMIARMQYRVIDIPSAQERKKGEWIRLDNGSSKCSACGLSLEDWIQAVFYNYCPNCGAQMKRSEDE